MKNLLLIGASGHGKVVAEIAQINGYRNIVFLDGAYPKKTKIGRWEVVGQPEINSISGEKNSEFFISIGNNKIREQLSLEFNINDSPTLSHSDSIISSYAKIGQGTLTCAGSIINIGANVGRYVIVNTGASIDHDCEISDFVHISPGARLAGGVKVGARTWIGIGAVVRENVKIGKDVIVGAGAAVVDDVADGVTVLGVPAIPVKE